MLTLAMSSFSDCRLGCGDFEEGERVGLCRLFFFLCGDESPDLSLPDLSDEELELDESEDDGSDGGFMDLFLIFPLERRSGEGSFCGDGETSFFTSCVVFCCVVRF